MNNLVIKAVAFNNVTMLAAQRPDGKIFVSVKKICDDLGLDSTSQIKKIKGHSVLSKGVMSITLPSNGGSQEAICIELKYFSSWLLAIIPSKCKEEVRPLLEQFQEKAADILTDAFFNKVPEQQPGFQIPKTLGDALILAGNLAKEKEAIEVQLIESKNEIEELTPMAAYAKSQFNNINKVALSRFGKYLSAKIPSMGSQKISAFLIEQHLLFKNRQGTPEPYSQYLRGNSKKQYFELKESSFEKPVYNQSGEQIGKKRDVSFQILLLEAGMRKVIELCYKSNLINNTEFFNLMQDLPMFLKNKDQVA